MLIELLFSVPVLLAPPVTEDQRFEFRKPSGETPKPSFPTVHTFSKTLTSAIDSEPLAPPMTADQKPKFRNPQTKHTQHTLPAVHTFSKTLTSAIDSRRYINGDGPGPIARVYRIFKEERYIRQGELFGGTVIELTEDTITVRNWSDFSRTFAVAPTLCSERIPMEWRFGCGHRLADVKLGDKVGFDLAPTARGPVVIGLGIYRRPGGTIPPAEDTHIPAKYRLHNRANAYQAVEEKILPKLPRMFLHFHP